MKQKPKEKELNKEQEESKEPTKTAAELEKEAAEKKRLEDYVLREFMWE